MTVSASRKEISSKIDGFYQREYPPPMAGMKNSSKNTFRIDQKKAYGFYEAQDRFHYPE